MEYHIVNIILNINLAVLNRFTEAAGEYDAEGAVSGLADNL